MVPSRPTAVHTSTPGETTLTATLLDLFGVMILAYNVLRGLTTGLIRTSVGAIAVVVATFVAWQYQEAAAPLVDPWVPPSFPLAFLLRPLVIWLLAFGGINLTGLALRWAVRVTPLVLADRIGGAVFGLFTGVVVLVIPMILVASFPLLQQIPLVQDALAHSAIAGLLTPLVHTVLGLVPVLPPVEMI